MQWSRNSSEKELRETAKAEYQARLAVATYSKKSFEKLKSEVTVKYINLYLSYSM